MYILNSIVWSLISVNHFNVFSSRVFRCACNMNIITMSYFMLKIIWTAVKPDIHSKELFYAKLDSWNFDTGIRSSLHVRQPRYTITRLSIEWAKPELHRAISLANHKGHRQCSEPIKTRNKAREKRVKASQDWFLRYFWLTKLREIIQQILVQQPKTKSKYELDSTLMWNPLYCKQHKHWLELEMTGSKERRFYCVLAWNTFVTFPPN